MNESTEIAKKVAQKRATKCRHFNGIQHDKCRAGISYDKAFPGFKLQLPCIPPLRGDGTPQAECAKRETYTAEELAEQEREIELAINGMSIARKAIVDDLARRHAKGDNTVTAKPHADSEFYETGSLVAYVAGQGEIQCPVCKKGVLRYSRAACNGHVHAACSTKGCVQWME